MSDAYFVLRIPWCVIRDMRYAIRYTPSAIRYTPSATAVSI